MGREIPTLAWQGRKEHQMGCFNRVHYLISEDPLSIRPKLCTFLARKWRGGRKQVILSPVSLANARSVNDHRPIYLSSFLSARSGLRNQWPELSSVGVERKMLAERPCCCFPELSATTGLQFRCLPGLRPTIWAWADKKAVTQWKTLHTRWVLSKQKSHLLTRQYHIVGDFLSGKTDSGAAVCVWAVYLVLQRTPDATLTHWE